MADPDQMRQKVIKELLEASDSALDPAEITPQTKLGDDLDLDSMQAVELVMDLEDEFGVQISDEEVDGLQTVGDILDLLARKTGSS